MLAASLQRVLGVRLTGFDYLVLAGAAVNLVVVGYLIGYWVLAG